MTALCQGPQIRMPPLEQAVLVAPSSGIRALQHIKSMLGVSAVIGPREVASCKQDVAAVLSWGRKSYQRECVALSQELQRPVWYLEDGWIRTCSANAHSRLCYSLLLDKTGVYYDASAPSDLENCLNLATGQWLAQCPRESLTYAAECRAQLVREAITKYNWCSNNLPDLPERLVLVIDQTRDDASVRFGGMDEARFGQMLQAAIEENPHAQVMVKTHPDVLSGQKQGYLLEAARRFGVQVLKAPVNPVSLVARAERVYSGSSQLGYEALLCERPVSVFGQPFYSGWGLTDDRQPITRRIRSRSIDELFHASHVRIARYANPVTGTPWELHQCLGHVALQKAMFRTNARQFHCQGITPWKRRYIRQYLRSPDGLVCFGRVAPRSRAGMTEVTWSYRRFQHTGPELTNKVMRIEDGFLRSAGLGSDLVAPASLVMDEHGLYFNPDSPSELEQLLNEHDCTETELQRAEQLILRLRSRGLSKYNLNTSNLVNFGTDRPVVLVVGQVEDDESIRRGCVDVHTNAGLLQAARQARPDAWVVYKPHPDVVAGNRAGRIETSVLVSSADQVITEANINQCVQSCAELHTLTSLTGFEALLHDKQVVTYGLPFYAGWGLTRDRHSLLRRRRQRSLVELVFLAMIAYPRYLDMASGEFMQVEDLVELLSTAQSTISLPSNRVGRSLFKIQNIIRALCYAP